MHFSCPDFSFQSPSSFLFSFHKKAKKCPQYLYLLETRSSWCPLIHGDCHQDKDVFLISYQVPSSYLNEGLNISWTKSQISPVSATLYRRSPLNHYPQLRDWFFLISLPHVSGEDGVFKLSMSRGEASDDQDEGEDLVHSEIVVGRGSRREWGQRQGGLRVRSRPIPLYHGKDGQTVNWDKIFRIYSLNLIEKKQTVLHPYVKSYVTGLQNIFYIIITNERPQFLLRSQSIHNHFYYFGSFLNFYTGAIWRRRCSNEVEMCQTGLCE